GGGASAANMAGVIERVAPPRSTGMVILTHYFSEAPFKIFQPINIPFALLPPLDDRDRRGLKRKADRRRLQVDLALKDFEEWRNSYLKCVGHEKKQRRSSHSDAG